MVAALVERLLELMQICQMLCQKVHFIKITCWITKLSNHTYYRKEVTLMHDLNTKCHFSTFLTMDLATEVDLALIGFATWVRKHIRPDDQHK